MEKDISATILQLVLQIGYLDHEKVMKSLMEFTKSKVSQFFEVVFGSNSTYICRYSSTKDYITGEKYKFDNLPFDQITIFHKSSVIAIVCLDNQDEFDSISQECRQRILDSICIGIVMGNLKDSNFNFTMSVCKELSRIITQIMDFFTSLTSSSSTKMDPDISGKIDLYLTDVIRILYDTIDYIEIDAEKIELQKDVVNMIDFVKETIEIGSFGNIGKDIDDNVPAVLILDKERVQQMLISVLKKINDLTEMRLQVSFVDYSSIDSFDVFIVFRFYSTKFRNNTEMKKRFTVDHVSVSSLDMFISKRLCEIMNGTFDVREDGIIVKIKTDLPGLRRGGGVRRG